MTGGRVYSLGYERLTPAGLLERLQQSRVTTLVDVRWSPYSRKPGFSRKALQAALAEAGIDYVHEQALGNPPEIRESWFDDVPAARERLRHHFEASTESQAALDRLIERARAERVAVLCLEAEEARCHRQVVFAHLAEAAPDIEILTLF